MAEAGSNGYRGKTPFEKAVIQRLDGLDGAIKDLGGAVHELRDEVNAIRVVQTRSEARAYEMQERMSSAGKALEGNKTP